MTLRPDMRALVALAAAYALALQAILLSLGGPFGAQGAGFGGVAICSGVGGAHSASSSVPFRHSGGCPGACLGCCCGPPACHTPSPAMAYAPAPEIVIAAFVAMPPFATGMPAAHRSRAPPLA